jgi:hypothetical protein
MHACIFLGYVHFMALAMVPAGSSRPIEKIVPGPLCFDAHFGAPLPPAPGAAAPPPPPPPSVRFSCRKLRSTCPSATSVSFRHSPGGQSPPPGEHFGPPENTDQKIFLGLCPRPHTGEGLIRPTPPPGLQL